MTEQSVEVVVKELARGTGELQEITSLETMDSMTPMAHHQETRDSMTLMAHHQETRVSVPILTD